MKDNELKLKEIEASHTLGGVGEGRVQGEGGGESGYRLLDCMYDESTKKKKP